MTTATVVVQTPYTLSTTDGTDLHQSVPTPVEVDERIQRYIDTGMVVVVTATPIATDAPASDTTKPRAVAARQDSQEN